MSESIFRRQHIKGSTLFSFYEKQFCLVAEVVHNEVIILHVFVCILRLDLSLNMIKNVCLKQYLLSNKIIFKCISLPVCNRIMAMKFLFMSLRIP